MWTGRHLRSSLKLAHYWNEGTAEPRGLLLPTFRWDEKVNSNHGEHRKWLYATGCSSLWETVISVFRGLPQYGKNLSLWFELSEFLIPLSELRILSGFSDYPHTSALHHLLHFTSSANTSWLPMAGPHLALLPSIHSHSTSIYLLNTNLGAKV